MTIDCSSPNQDGPPGRQDCKPPSRNQGTSRKAPAAGDKKQEQRGASRARRRLSMIFPAIEGTRTEPFGNRLPGRRQATLCRQARGANSLPVAAYPAMQAGEHIQHRFSGKSFIKNNVASPSAERPIEPSKNAVMGLRHGVVRNRGLAKALLEGSDIIDTFCRQKSQSRI